VESSTATWTGLVIAFGNYAGTYYRYAKRHEAARHLAAATSEPLGRE